MGVGVIPGIPVGFGVEVIPGVPVGFGVWLIPGVPLGIGVVEGLGGLGVAGSAVGLVLRVLVGTGVAVGA